MKILSNLIKATCAIILINTLPADCENVKTEEISPQELSILDGAALVTKLENPASRSAAFYELWRRANPDKAVDYASFQKNHYKPEVVVCPQPDSNPPLYAVLYGFLSDHELSDGEYKIENPYELFVPDMIGRPSRFWTEPAINVFAHDGTQLLPFGWNNVLNEPGILADINGDGFVERADHVSYIDDTDVLQVSVVEETARPVFSVLYNMGTSDWFYKLTDTDGDGIFDIELGPKTFCGIETKVIYRWNRDTQSYDGPTGKEGDHFRVLDAGNVQESLKCFEKQKLQFPSDPDFVDDCGQSNDLWSRRGLKKPSPSELSSPYQYQSLKNLSNEALIHYMDDGKGRFDLEWDTAIKDHIPEGFWSMNPKTAAIAMAQSHRYPYHQQRYKLAIDDRDGCLPPEICSIAFTSASDISYNAVNSHWFLRVDPEKSYFTYARSWEGGSVFYNFVHNQPAYNLRFCALSYETARHIAQTIWWLDHVRSMARPSNGGGYWSTTTTTTADGDGSLIMRTETGATSIDITEALRAVQVSELWSGNYDKEIFLNLATILIAKALPEQLGTAWSDQASEYSHDIQSRQTSAPEYAENEKTRLKAMTGQFLDLFTPDQTQISYAIIAEAAHAAGELCFLNLEPRLTEILSILPAEMKAKRTYEEVRAEINRLDEQIDSAEDPSQLREQRDKLETEIESLLFDDIDYNSVSHLRDSILLSLKKLNAADDLQGLQNWACSKDPGCQWALQRLSKLDKHEYVSSLEWWLKNSANKRARQIYDEITKVDAQRATEIAEAIPADQISDLAVSAFSQLDKINDMPDEAKRIQSLINVILTPESDWEERGRAIDLLVPYDTPLRYPSQEIDQALLKLFDPELADDTINFTLGKACHALARRGRTEWFDYMASRLKEIKDPYVYQKILGALTHLAQADPEKLNPQLLEIIRPHLTETDKNMTYIFWAIWSADLRELKPRLEEIATSCPDDYQGIRANMEGGGVTPVNERYHLARQIVAIWNEEDPATKAKMLAVMCKNKELYFTEECGTSGPEYRMKMEMEKAGRELTPDAQEEVRTFLQWLDSQPALPDPYDPPSEDAAPLTDMARQTMGL